MVSFTHLALAIAFGSANVAAFAPRARFGKAMVSRTRIASDATEGTTPSAADIIAATTLQTMVYAIKDYNPQRILETAGFLATLQAGATPDPPQPSDVFHGIKIPSYDPIEGRGILNSYTKSLVDSYGGAALVTGLLTIPDHDKDDPRSLVFLQLVASQLMGLETKPSLVTNPLTGYQIFGNGDSKKQLKYLLKNNPFMTAALVATDTGFELKSYDPDTDTPTLFQQVMDTMRGDGHRVNLELDDQLEITSAKLYDKITGEEINPECLKTSKTEDDLQFLASSAIYNIIVFASSIHATIHVFHYLLTSALMYACGPDGADYPELLAVANAYGENIRNKYYQVGDLLIGDPPKPNVLSAPDTRILTGEFGFGSGQDLRPILEAVLKSWGQSQSAPAFINTLISLPQDKMDASGLLPEFFKQVSLIPEFAAGVTETVKDMDNTKFNEAEEIMTKYLVDCGAKFDSKITSLETWLALMSVSGQIHAGTMSYTRLLGTKDILRWRDITKSKWDSFDMNIAVGGLGTIIGAEPDHYVMSSTIAEFDRRIKCEFEKSDEKTTKFKEEYTAALEELAACDPEEFNNFGFLMTDYSDDFFDGKQVTISTYI